MYPLRMSNRTERLAIESMYGILRVVIFVHSCFVDFLLVIFTGLYFSIIEATIPTTMLYSYIMGPESMTDRAINIRWS